MYISFPFFVQVRLGQKFYKHQVRLDQGSNSCPPDVTVTYTFHVTDHETHALTTQLSVTFSMKCMIYMIHA